MQYSPYVGIRIVDVFTIFVGGVGWGGTTICFAIFGVAGEGENLRLESCVIHAGRVALRPLPIANTKSTAATSLAAAGCRVGFSFKTSTTFPVPPIAPVRIPLVPYSAESDLFRFTGFVFCGHSFCFLELNNCCGLVRVRLDRRNPVIFVSFTMM